MSAYQTRITHKQNLSYLKNEIEIKDKKMAILMQLIENNVSKKNAIGDFLRKEWGPSDNHVSSSNDLM